MIEIKLLNFFLHEIKFLHIMPGETLLPQMEGCFERHVLVMWSDMYCCLLTHLCLSDSCRYPYNNALHHHVESVIMSCLESKNDDIVDHLLRDCDLVGKFLKTDKHPILSGDDSKVDKCNYQVDAYILMNIFFGICSIVAQ